MLMFVESVREVGRKKWEVMLSTCYVPSFELGTSYASLHLFLIILGSSDFQ